MVNDYVIVDKSILPKCYSKVADAKKLLQSGKVENVTDACKKTGISRSTFYKYQEKVFSYENSIGRKAVFTLLLSHKPGALSNVCSTLSDLGISILTISQAMPVGETAPVTVSCDISNASKDIKEIKRILEKIKEVNKCELLAFEG